MSIWHVVGLTIPLVAAAGFSLACTAIQSDVSQPRHCAGAMMITTYCGCGKHKTPELLAHLRALAYHSQQCQQEGADCNGDELAEIESYCSRTTTVLWAAVILGAACAIFSVRARHLCALPRARLLRSLQLWAAHFVDMLCGLPARLFGFRLCCPSHRVALCAVRRSRRNPRMPPCQLVALCSVLCVASSSTVPLMASF